MMFKFFLTERSVNEATDFYISLIERAILAAGYNSERIFSVKQISGNDVVVTIEAKDFLKVKLLKPGHKQINWYQGIVPEEAMMMFNSAWRKVLWEFFERLTLSKAELNLFVSQAMRQHYIKKYAYTGRHDLIIPCYNKPLTEAAFFINKKYTSPSFVYAGSLAAWQCINETLQIYKGVETAIPEASLTLLTADQEKAMELVKKYGIRNCEVRFCALAQLDQELSKYKYGFLIREAHIVNKVATPTKMNSYLALGVIPVFSDVVEAFKENLPFTGQGAIMINTALSLEQKVQQIVNFERHVKVLPQSLYEEYTRLFNNYYNDEVYITALSKKINELIVC